MTYRLDGIIDPFSRFKNAPKVAKHTILCHHPSFFDILTKLEHTKIIKIIDCDKYYKHALIKYKKININIVNAYFGPVPTAHRVFEFFARGSRVFVQFGACGSLKNLPLGSIILPIEAKRYENTSSVFISKKIKAEPDSILLHTLESALKLKKYPYYKGLIGSVDSIYGYSKKDIAKFKKDNILALDSETSMFFLAIKWLSKKYPKLEKPKCASVNYISDIIPLNRKTKWISDLDSISKLLPYKENCLIICMESIFLYSKKTPNFYKHK